MNVIKVQSVPKKENKTTSEDVLARFCYYFPQYTYFEARKLPVIRIRKMLAVVDIEKNKFYHEMVQVVSAPHTSKGSGVGKLLSKYEKLING